KTDGTPITTTPLLSDENGYAISELLEADEKGTTYIVEETKAPVGYTLDDRYYPLKKKVVVKPLQSSDIILENQKADAKASNYVPFL
ncbi:prealbumin-like fold domain-containing protein, partial [Erysipelatoclostridium ramosum]